MTKKHQEPQDLWQTEPTPIWVTEGGIIKPTYYFLRWWQDISKRKYGTPDRWLDVAVELGYVRKDHNPISGHLFYEPEGFDYDPVLVRNTLGISEAMPIIRYCETGQDAYHHMLNKLVNDDGGNNDNLL